MRTLRTSLVLAIVLAPTAVLVSGAAHAQPTDPAAPPAAPSAETPPPAAEPPPPPPAAEPAPPAEPAPAPVTPAPAPAPAADASASADASVGVGAVVQMGDSAGAASTRGGGSGNSSGSYGGPQTSSDDEWKFGFNGYLRAPMRIGVGSRIHAKPDQAVTTLTSPQIPNDQYLDWQYTKSVQRSWLESFFSYGNNWAKGVFAIQAFRFTDSSFPDSEAQFGVGQAWVELTPDMMAIDENLRVNAKVGSFWGRYGGAGQYDAGAYDTFIIGRTHTMGESVRAEYDLDDMTVFFEEGFGTKQPHPSPFNSTKFTLLGHLHGGFNWDQLLSVNAHYMRAWTQEPDHDCVSREEEAAYYGQKANGDQTARDDMMTLYAEAPVGACKHETAGNDKTVGMGSGGGIVRRSDSPDGHVDIMGIDAVLTPGALGRFFVGYSHINAVHAVSVDSAFETIHADGGGFFKMGLTHQYFVSRKNWDNPTTWNGGGNGSIDSIEWQWDLSLSSLIGSEVFGQQALDLQAFMMLNLIKSTDDTTMDGISKLKFGAELTYSPLSWFGIGLRGDQVNPRSDVPEQAFTVLRPRLVFRSDYGTHEEIEIGYARYFYAQRECSNGDWVACVQPPNATVGPDGWGNRPGINSAKTGRGTPVDVDSTVGPYNADAGAIQGWDPPQEQAFYISANIWW